MSWCDDITLQNFKFSQINRPDSALATTLLFLESLKKDGKPIFLEELEGSPSMELDDILNLFSEINGRTISTRFTSDNSCEKLISFDDGVLFFYYTKDNINFDLTFSDQDLFEKCRKIIRTIVSNRDDGSIFTIMNNGGRIGIKKLCNVGLELEKENYTPKNIEDFNSIVNKISSPNPGGRLIIIDGPPGTGKTYFVRSLLNNINAKFILVPANLVLELTGPQLLPILISGEDDYYGTDLSLSKKKKQVLVIEDADECLVPRQSDNMGLISALLNLGDGILGHALDLHIIATTNAKKINMDPAILRPGRLMKRVEINLLDKNHAEKVYKRLANKEISLENKQHSLAEIYELAKM